MKILKRENTQEFSPDHDSTTVISQDCAEGAISVKCPLTKLENTLGQMSRAKVHSFYTSCDPELQC